jgi:hypothetical protein
MNGRAKMNQSTKQRLVENFLETWASREYHLPLSLAYGRSKGSKEEFDNLKDMLSELIYKVESMYKPVRDIPVKLGIEELHNE